MHSLVRFQEGSQGSDTTASSSLNHCREPPGCGLVVAGCSSSHSRAQNVGKASTANRSVPSAEATRQVPVIAGAARFCSATPQAAHVTHLCHVVLIPAVVAPRLGLKQKVAGGQLEDHAGQRPDVSGGVVPSTQDDLCRTGKAKEAAGVGGCNACAVAARQAGSKLEITGEQWRCGCQKVVLKGRRRPWGRLPRGTSQRLP